MKKIIIGIVLVLAVILIVRYAKKDEVVVPTTEEQVSESSPTIGVSSPSKSSTKPTSKPSTLDGSYDGSKFTFVPAAGYSVDTSADSAWRGNTEIPGTRLVQVIIPQTAQPQTNFGDARFTIGMSSNAQAIKSCSGESNGERADGTVVINGVPFMKFKMTDAGAGNYYDTTSYRIVRNGACYSLEYTIHWTNLDNYGSTTGVKAFDTKKITGILETMAQSFKFK